jgi:hypothetical protein
VENFSHDFPRTDQPWVCIISGAGVSGCFAMVGLETKRLVICVDQSEPGVDRWHLWPGADGHNAARGVPSLGAAFGGVRVFFVRGAYLGEEAMSDVWAGVIVSLLLGVAGIYLGLRKQPAEIRSMDSTALKNAMEANNMLSEQFFELQTRLEVLERATRGPFRLVVEFSTGENPKIHKAELSVIR